MTRQRSKAPSAFLARLNDAIAARGLSARQVVLGLPQRSLPTVYRILAGTTSDPHASTLLALCRAIDVDPDELLGITRPGLEPEAEALLDEVEALDEEDRWLLVSLVRAVARRRASP